MFDYYELLGLERECDDGDIRKAYLRMAVKYHPDKNPDDLEGAEEMFKRILEAYQCLSDRAKRANYDNDHRVDDDDEPDTGGETPETAMRMFREVFPEGEDAFEFLYEDKRRKKMGLPLGTPVLVGARMGEVTLFDGEFYTVRINEDVVSKLKRSDVQLIVEGVELRTTQEMNGKMGVLFGFAKGRYRIRVDGKNVNVLPRNCVLPIGTHVVVTGLSSGTEHNGQEAKLIDVDRVAMRYTVEGVTKRLKLKFENVRV